MSNNIVLGENSIVIGTNNRVAHANCIVIGHGLHTTENNQILIGHQGTMLRKRASEAEVKKLAEVLMTAIYGAAELNTFDDNTRR